MKTSIAFVLAAFLLVACMPTSAAGTEVSASYPTITPEWNAAPSSFPTVTPEWLSATLTPPPYYGYLQFPFLNADAGNFQLQSGATITFTWVDPPPGAVYCEIALYPLDGGPMMMLGRDSDPSDGVTLEWTVAPDLAAELKAFVYYGGDQPVLAFSGLYVYSPSLSQ